MALKTHIRVGVVGYGGAFNMGRQHLLEMRKAGLIPVVVADTDEARLRAAEKDFPGIETYGSVKEMLRSCEVDLLAIVTPHDTHAELALQCLAAGKHVVVEKPMAITTRQCDAMIAAARKNKLTLSAYHNRHWDGCILNAVKRLKAGAIGEVVRVEAHMGGWSRPDDWWRSSKSVSGGILYDWGVHLLEYTLQIVQSEIVEVTGFATRGVWAPKTAWKRDAIEDEATVVVRYASGAWSSLTMSGIDAKPREGWVDVTGTKGSYSFDHATWTLTTPRKESVTTVRGRSPESEGYRFYQNVAAHLMKGEKLVISAEWARRPIQIIDLANQSAEKGAAVKAQYP
jgi:scyllo-inositol 2-dehydrogenase (NADP+)